MSKELSVQDEHAIVMHDLAKTQEICGLLMKTPHYSKLGEVGVYTIVQKARSIGLNPLDALNGAMYFVQGKVELSANTMNYLIRRAGHSVTRDDKSNKTICVLHGRRVDNGDTWTCSFSIDDAKKAGIYKATWEKYPEDMLFARALTRLARQLFPDVIKGCYVEGEISAAISVQNSVSLEIDETSQKETISFDQLMEFEDLMADCSQEHQDKFIKYLKETKVDLYENIPLKSFEKFKGWALEWRAKNQINKIKEITEEVKYNEDKIEQATFNFG